MPQQAALLRPMPHTLTYPVAATHHRLLQLETELLTPPRH